MPTSNCRYTDYNSKSPNFHQCAGWWLSGEQQLSPLVFTPGWNSSEQEEAGLANHTVERITRRFLLFTTAGEAAAAQAGYLQLELEQQHVHEAVLIAGVRAGLCS